MMKDITWGQYHSVDSMIHRLDPRVKIRFTIVYIILLLLDRNLPLFVFLTAVFAGTWACSRVPMRKMIRGTRGIFLFILICSALNAFTVHGTTLVKLGVLTVTKEGLIKAGFVFWRMLLLILMSSLLMYTTTPTRLTDGMEKCMHLSGGVAMGITIALRFVPILF
ncbi:MAG: energy-coupling factor transporter transmembrane component T, partial [Clostridium sp.]|nr:energy-coupling factor transporter transmembrane component T [Clostridium sp.]